MKIDIGDKVTVRLCTGTILSGIVNYLGEKPEGGDLDSIWATDWIIVNGVQAGHLFAKGGTYYVAKNQILTVEKKNSGRKGRWIRFEKSCT